MANLGDINLAPERLNEVRTMNNGLLATIIAYRTNADIDIRFNESGVVVCNRRYWDFQHGRVVHPLVISEHDGYSEVTNLNARPPFMWIMDSDSVHLLGSWKWNRGGGGSGYVTGGNKRGGKLMLLHRLIVNAPDDTVVDHINHNVLDNRKENLRICSIAENIRNSKLRANNTSGYKGVCWLKRDNKWLANITFNSKTIYLGKYNDIIDAAQAYNDAAIKYFGEYASLNEISVGGV